MKTEPTPETDAGAAGSTSEEELARGRVEVETARFDRDLARKAKRRLERELSKLERRAAELETERISLRSVVDERDQYLSALNASKVWRLVQALRGLLGRRW